MAYNKFITKSGDELLNLTDSTVTKENLAKDIIAYDRHGDRIVGELEHKLQTDEFTPDKIGKTITPSDDAYGLKEVLVKPIPDEYIIPNGTIDITSNGTIDVTTFASASVEVQPALQSKEVTPSTSEQTIVPDSGTYGLSSVKVKAIPSNYTVPTGTKTITTNGTVDVAAFASAAVSVQPVLQEKTAVANGVITPDYGYAGLSKVTVATPEPKIAYSTSQPSDTNKLWVQTSSSISSTKFTTSPPEKLTYNIGTLADTQRNAEAVTVGSGSNAKIYLLGGSNSSKYIDTIKAFDPTTETITTITDDSITGLAMSRMGVSAVGNTLYFFGGYSQTSSTAIHAFNTSTRKLTTLSTVLPEAISTPTAAAYGNKIYIFGGKNSSGTPINSITVFDTNANTATKLSVTLPSTGAYTNMATAVIGSKIYLIGGLKANGSRTAKINIFDTTNSTISTAPVVLPTPADGIAATAVSPNIYLFGGETDENALSTINVFNTHKNQITTTRLELPYAQSAIAAAAAGTTCYLFGGGWSSTYYNTISRFTTVPTVTINTALIELDCTKNSAYSLIPQIEAGIKSAYIKSGILTTRMPVYQYINGTWTEVASSI